jgi:hypothetical protein
MSQATQKGWIEPSNAYELQVWPEAPYRMCFDSGERFALSTLDAIRAQKDGMEFVPVHAQEGRQS